ncbi:MAG: hypothetical protein ACLPX5_03115 [Dissulfurispiraceae bacterium]
MRLRPDGEEHIWNNIAIGTKGRMFDVTAIKTTNDANGRKLTEDYGILIRRERIITMKQGEC